MTGFIRIFFGKMGTQPNLEKHLGGQLPTAVVPALSRPTKAGDGRDFCFRACTFVCRRCSSSWRCTSRCRSAVCVASRRRHSCRCRSSTYAGASGGRGGGVSGDVGGASTQGGVTVPPLPRNVADILEWSACTSMQTNRVNGLFTQLRERTNTTHFRSYKSSYFSCCL